MRVGGTPAGLIHSLSPWSSPHKPFFPRCTVYVGGGSLASQPAPEHGWTEPLPVFCTTFCRKPSPFFTRAVPARWDDGRSRLFVTSNEGAALVQLAFQHLPARRAHEPRCLVSQGRGLDIEVRSGLHTPESWSFSTAMWVGSQSTWQPECGAGRAWRGALSLEGWLRLQCVGHGVGLEAYERLARLAEGRHELAVLDP
jgi:hypothetical protein